MVRVRAIPEVILARALSLAPCPRSLAEVQHAGNSHKKAQKSTKKEARAHAWAASWTAGLLPRTDLDCFRKRALQGAQDQAEALGEL